MANSTTHIDQIQQSQASKEVTANGFFDAASVATIFGRRQSTCSGLTWGYYGGNVLTNGYVTQIANGTITLTASTTNYIMSTTSGVLSVNTTGFTSGLTPLYSVVTGASSVTSYTDYRLAVPDHQSKYFLAMGDANQTLTWQGCRSNIFSLTGALTAPRTITVPLIERTWTFHNNTTGGFQVYVVGASGTGVVIANGKRDTVYCDTVNVASIKSNVIEGKFSKALSDANYTLAKGEDINAILEFTGTLTVGRNIVIPLYPRQYTVFNNSTGGFALTFIGPTGTGVAVAATKRAIIYADGTNVVRVTADV